jgi:hypothetical protein
MAPVGPPTSEKLQEVARDPTAWSGALLLFGSVAWKVLSVWSNLDFLLSIKSEGFAVMFSFFQDEGWIVIAFIGALALLAAWTHKTTKAKEGPTWLLVSISRLMRGTAANPLIPDSILA